MSDEQRVAGYEIWRLEAPLGRLIGDNNCEYDVLDVVAVCLRTRAGIEAWGYDATCWKGKFRVPAWYIKPMASQAEMSAVFEKDWLPILNSARREAGGDESETSDPTVSSGSRRRSPSIARTNAGAVGGRASPRAESSASRVTTTIPYLDTAVKMALWDLTAKEAGLPLYQLLGGKAGQNRVRAYGSILDFPVSEEAATALARKFVARGFRTIKVKIGADDVNRDIQRLHAIRRAVGPDVELTADANTIWTCDRAIANLGEIAKSGIALGYIEDPLPHTDVDGFARLARTVDLMVIGHDYASTLAEVRALLAARGIARIRAGANVDYNLGLAALAEEFDAPLIFGNGMFEIGVHSACALPKVDRLEFSDLGWNDLMREPVRFENGCAIAPDRPGHGLDPRPEVLKDWHRPTE